jgi:hypothetical protein
VRFYECFEVKTKFKIKINGKHLAYHEGVSANKKQKCNGYGNFSTEFNSLVMNKKIHFM